MARCSIRSWLELDWSVLPGSPHKGCMACELDEAGLAFQRQLAVPLQCNHLSLEAGFRADLVFERSILVEVKAVERLHPVVDAPVLTYLRLLGLQTGLVINFHAPLRKDGIRRLMLRRQQQRQQQRQLPRRTRRHGGKTLFRALRAVRQFPDHPRTPRPWERQLPLVL